MDANNSTPDWTALHDLGLVYLALAHGSDTDLSPDERNLMGEKLQEWSDRASQPMQETDKVLNDVMLVYMGGSGDQMLRASVVSLKETLDKPLRVAVLNDLADVASADGQLVEGEISFIQRLVREWDVEKEVS